MSEMERPEWKPVIVEVAEVGREVIKLTFSSLAEFSQWQLDEPQREGEEEISQ